MKKLFLLLSLFIPGPATACSEVEIQSQRTAAVADSICQLGNEGVIEKRVAKELYNNMLKKLSKNYENNKPLAGERLTRVFILLDLNCEL